jgi:HSPB1-associated protein 1
MIKDDSNIDLNSEIPIIYESFYPRSDVVYSKIFESLKDIATNFRVGPIGFPRSIKENECIQISGKYSELNDWTSGVDICSDSSFSKLPSFLSQDIFVYADYKHFGDIFPEDGVPSINIWKNIGLNTITDLESTIWYGSKSSHTPLHYDSYGYNIVVQLRGEKNWKLWRPGSLNGSERRIPYEESSVYSDYDPLRNDEDTKPPAPDFDIILKAGDVLIVPKHWWHFVITVF